MEEVDIPSFFICPISLNIMKDPVTLPTGITYDRESIESWIFSSNQMSCPITKQPLAGDELTPNHTLRRLIQGWCALNESNGIERFPTPRAPVDKTQISKLIKDAAAASPESLSTSLHKIQSIVSERERNRRCFEATPGAVDFLVSIITTATTTNFSKNEYHDSVNSRKALEILHSLQISDEGVLLAIGSSEGFLGALGSLLARSNDETRAKAMQMVKSVVSVVSPTRLMGIKVDLFEETVRVLKDRVSRQETKAGLQVLGWLSPWGRNRIKAVNAGAVRVLVEILVEESEGSVCEMAMVVLDRLCGCAEGRAKFAGHPAGIAVVAKRMVWVSEVTSERAVRILHSLARYSATPAVLKEMAQAGAVSKMCLLLEVGCGIKAREKAREVLRLHSRVWKKSPCLAPHFLATYPS